MLAKNPSASPRSETPSTPADLFEWDDELGFGMLPIEPDPDLYGAAYFEKYERYAQTDLGKRLLTYRLGLLNRFTRGQPLIDVGIGCGALVAGRGARTFGFDVNPVAVEWLTDRGLLQSPYERNPEHVSCFDSLEHLADPANLIRRVRRTITVSIPVAESRSEWLESRHFRPGEHLWYFSRPGLIRYFDRLGFEVAALDTGETELGRESIITAVFRRRKWVL